MRKLIAYPLTTLFLIVLINSCEKPNDDSYIQNYSNGTSGSSFISIPNFDNPETMWEESNISLYNEAYDRFMSKAQIINGTITTSIQSGKEISISEDIFDYIKENITLINNQVVKGSMVLIQEEEEILYARKSLKPEISSFSWKQENYTQNPVNIWSPPSEIVNRVGMAYSSYRAGQSGNFSDYFTWNSLNYNRTGNSYFAGYNVTYHISSSVSTYQPNNPNNSFVSAAERTYGNYTYFDIRNGQGNTLMSIRVYGSAGATALRNKLNNLYLGE